MDVRALGRDMGRSLGTYGHVTALRRLSVGPFTEDELVPFDAIRAAHEANGPEASDAFLRPIEAALRQMTEVILPQGDAVLRSLGSLMRSMSREGDVPCRVGGEEFAFILPETAKGDALTFAERFRRGVEQSIMAPDSSYPITVSIGLAAFPEDGKSIEEILWAADEALYESKRGGRNRVTLSNRREPAAG